MFYHAAEKELLKAVCFSSLNLGGEGKVILSSYLWAACLRGKNSASGEDHGRLTIGMSREDFTLDRALLLLR